MRPLILVPGTQVDTLSGPLPNRLYGPRRFLPKARKRGEGGAQPPAKEKERQDGGDDVEAPKPKRDLIPAARRSPTRKDENPSITTSF